MHTHTTPRAVLLCIISLLLSSTLATPACYDSLTNDAAFTVEQTQPYFNPYPCTLSTDSVAYDAGSHTHTFTIGAGPTCGEMMSTQEVTYGYYECSMIPPGVAGTVTSCMVTNNIPGHYESVYIKFIGNDTDRVYLGFFANGQPYSAGPVALWFHPTNTDIPHRYGFEWTSGYIKWYIDSSEVSSNVGNQAIPTTPNYFVVGLVTEADSSDFKDTNTYIPTDTTVGRVFNGNASAGLTATFSNISYTPVLNVACDNSTGIIPGSGGGYDPDACDLRSVFTVFDEKLAKGWTTTDSSTSNFEDTTNVHSGSYAISWDVTQGARLYLIAPDTFLSSNYDQIEFWVYGNGLSGQQLGIQMLLADGTPFPTQVVEVSDVIGNLGGIQPWEWIRVVIPFTKFGLAPQNTSYVDCKGFVISSLQSSFGGRIGIDGVILGYTLPMCANKTSVIYDDQLAKGYSDYSWGAPAPNLKSTDSAHSGAYSVEWILYQSGGVQFHTSKGVSTGSYPAISFWINTAKLTGWDWTVAFTNDGSTADNQVQGTAINLMNYYGGVMPNSDGQWTHIIIPFYEFGVSSGTKLNGIIFQLTSDQYQGTLYIDDIEYIDEVSPSSGTALKASAFLLVTLVLYSLL